MNIWELISSGQLHTGKNFLLGLKRCVVLQNVIFIKLYHKNIYWLVFHVHTNKVQKLPVYQRFISWLTCPMYNYVIVLGVSLLGLVLNQCNDSHYLEYHTWNILKQMWTILPKFAVPFNQLARYMQMYFLIRACEKSYIDKHIKLLTRIAVLFL